MGIAAYVCYYHLYTRDSTSRRRSSPACSSPPPPPKVPETNIPSVDEKNANKKPAVSMWTRFINLFKPTTKEESEEKEG